MATTRETIAGRVTAAMPWMVVAVAAVLSFRRISDFDTWWHLASGRWIVTNAGVPNHDTLSFTVPDHEWINLQWLFDILIYGVHTVGGANLLVWFSAAGFTLGVCLLVRSLRLSVGPIAAAFIAAWALVVVQERFVLRPELLTFIYVVALVTLIATRTRDDGKRLWLAVPLMLVWVNSHALFIVGVFCLWWTAVATLAASRMGFLPAAWRESTRLSPPGERRMLVATAAATAITLVNPYLARGVLFPFELLSRIDSGNTAFRSIGEFQRPFSGFFPTMALGAYQAYFFAGCLLMVVGALLAARPRAKPRRNAAVGTMEALAGGRLDRFDLAGVGVFIALAYLSLQARRNTGLFVLGVSPFIAQSFAVLAARVPPLPERARVGARLAAGAVAVVASLSMIVWTATNGFYHWDNRTQEFGSGVLDVNFAVHASEFSRGLGLKPNLYNDFTAGGYLTWSRPVAAGVFLDGRLEVYDAEFFSDYTQGLRSFDRWRSDAERYKIETVILFHRWANRRNLVRRLSHEPAWTLIYYDETSALFVRTEGNAEVIAAARAKFAPLVGRAMERLREHANSWQTPVGDIHGAISYGELLTSLGAHDQAAEAFRLAIEMGLVAPAEVGLRSWLARYHVARGEKELALLQVRAGLLVEPENQLLLEAVTSLSR